MNETSERLFWSGLPQLTCFLLCILARSAHAQNKSTPLGADELGELYFNVLSSYNAFPPLASAEVWQDDSIEPIQAIMANVIVSIDVISPSTSEFTVTSLKMLYWNKDACNLTEAHADACAETVGNGLHFFNPLDSNEVEIKYALHQDEIHAADFQQLGIPDLTPSVDIVSDQTTFKQQFDMRTYPYEIHNLRILYTSLFSSNIVSLTQLPNVEDGSLDPIVPPGWTLESATCGVQVNPEERGISRVSEEEIIFPSYLCTVQVSRRNTGWWMTSFLLFIGLNLISFVAGLGVTSHLVAEAKDDKDSARAAIFDGMRLNGVFSLGLLLTYVFQVELAPYAQSIEFWPSIPASTMIYILGLVGILLASGVSMVQGLMAKKVLVVDGFVGGVTVAYRLDEVPQEGISPEEDFPLRNDNIGEDPSSKADKGQDGHDYEMREGEKTPEGVQEVSTDEATPPEKSLPGPESSKLDVVEKQVDKPERAPVSRRSNTKNYNVLSVQEAINVNRIVRFDLFSRTFLIFSVAVAGAAIMIKARTEFEDLKL